MKRGSDFDTESEQKRRRQPQISCDSCRKKKLKCDRAEPCSSCVIRGLPCTGQPGSQKPAARSSASPVNASSDDSIVGRLRRLEQAVFGSAAATTGASADQLLNAVDSFREETTTETRRRLSTSLKRSSQRSTLNSERQQTAKFLDSTFAGNGLNISLPYGKMDYRVGNVSQFPKTPVSTTPGLTPPEDPEPRLSTWLMTREEALNLLQDFIENPFHLLPIIHGPSARSMIDAFYSRLLQGKDPHPAHAALILGIAATSAFFFNGNSKIFDTGTSTEEATHAALAWFGSSLNILEKSQARDYGSFEAVQARCILAYLVYNMEGCSARFRYLHGCSLSSAREISLHLIDSPNSEQQDDTTTREFKRRVWWHITATDWMLGLMGGPTDGTYNVHPRQMNVKHPRNINDDDLSLSDETVDLPPETATMMSCFIRRTQLAEIARSIIDARAPGVPDAEIIDYDQVLELDRLFEDAFADLPPFLRPEGPVPPNAPRYLELQRDVVLLGFNSRRARLHRPFLLHDKEDSQYQPSRDICLRSARTVLSISSNLLKTAQTKEPVQGDTSRVIGNRLGCVIGHMFMACAILALNAGLVSGRGTPGAEDDGDGTSSDSTAKIHEEVARACRALAVAGEESAVAANLVRNLVGVLRKYRVQGVYDVVSSESEPTADSAGPDAQDEQVSGEGAVPGRYTREKQDHCDDYYSGMVGENDLGLDGLWNNILGDTSNPYAYGWDQVFAGLDTYCGPT